MAGALRASDWWQPSVGELLLGDGIGIGDDVVELTHLYDRRKNARAAVSHGAMPSSRKATAVGSARKAALDVSRVAWASTVP